MLDVMTSRSMLSMVLQEHSSGDFRPKELRLLFQPSDPMELSTLCLVRTISMPSMDLQENSSGDLRPRTLDILLQPLDLMGLST